MPRPQWEIDDFRKHLIRTWPLERAGLPKITDEASDTLREFCFAMYLVDEFQPTSQQLYGIIQFAKWAKGQS